MERLNTFLIIILILLNTFFVFSMKSQKTVTENVGEYVELVEFQSQMSEQLFVVENEVRALSRKISDFPIMGIEQAGILEQTNLRDENLTEVNRNEHTEEMKNAARLSPTQDSIDLINIYVTDIISGGVINHESALDLQHELSKLDRKTFEAVLSRINVAINNQELQLEPGVVL